MKQIKTSHASAIIVAVVVLVLSGCAPIRALTQPGAPDNLDLFKVGTEKVKLVAEFEAPTTSFVKNERQYDIFYIPRGQSGVKRTGLAFGNLLLDVCTLFTWELISLPLRNAGGSDQLSYQVRYDNNNVVDEVVVLRN